MIMVKNSTFFHLFFVGNIGQKNVLYDILKQTNKRHLRLEKQEVPKVEKLAFFQRG